MATSTSAPLAIDGGSAVRATPLPPWPWFDAEQVAAASRVLESGRINYWTGDEGRKFEQEWAAHTGTDHALALANGTVSLEMIVRTLGIGPGDDVIVTPRTFIASVACVVGAGARPIFADVDRDSQNITAETIAAVLTPNTKAVIPVHLAGWPCDMPAIMELADRHGFAVIEDAAQAHGAEVDGLPVGSYGTATSYSFCQDKIITTGGEGGAVTTNDDDLWDQMWAFRDHGKSHREVFRDDHAPGFRWVHNSFGTNARMTEMQSAIGRIQIQRLPEWTRIRTRNAEILNDACRATPGLRVTEPGDGIVHAYYKHYVFVEPGQLRPGWDRDRIMLAIAAEGIPAYTGSCPEVYRERAFDKRFRPEARLPVARELGETSLMFMVHPTLEAADMEDAAEAIRKVMAHAAA
jgi:dTDP-4-amino-4,6-dideoxygalactose transaminase